MVEATNELLLRTLQQDQDTLGEHSRRFDATDRRFETLDRTIDNLTQLASTAVGFAGTANLRHNQVDTPMAELEARFGTLEDFQRRVTHLEQAG